ncbi:MAG TPA: hypothetical protein ENN68_02300 [Methanomicrobia archaeon]|nr:hypothetical protein [Methanomicrobia archaeon]
MNGRRVLIATVIGLLCGLFCAYGTVMMDDPTFMVTTGVLAAIVYNRVLIGFVVGIGDGLKLHPVLRGALFGAVITMALSISPIVDGAAIGGLTLIGFGIVYGILADLIATWATKEHR